jgi:glyoxylase-like metal-dependent hydrolase (beta-lactamase superfamily II)
MTDMTASKIPNYLHTLSLPTPFPVGPVNVYLAEGEPLTLIDTGPHHAPTREALASALAETGRRIEEIERIIITHAHADHYGLAAELAQKSGAEIVTHVDSPLRSNDGSGLRQMAFYGQMMRWSGVPVKRILKLAGIGRGMSHYAKRIRPDRSLTDGDSLRLGEEDWRVLHTPGHTGDLICLYQSRRQLLISSDHLLQDVSSNPTVEPPPPGETERPRRLVEYMAQLRRVAQLEVALALPGHGPPITDHRALIQERLAFHEKRARRILEILEEEPLTIHEIVEVLFPNLDLVNYFLALSEVIGHLQWLEVKGWISHTERFGVARWQPHPNPLPP